MSARRVDVVDEATLSEPDYASAFEIAREATDPRSPEQWARAIWEGAPLGVRWFLVTGWIAGLGFRLGRRPSQGHVLGWKIVSATPEVIVMESLSRLMTAHNLVRVEGSRVLWTTFVRYEKRPARALWLVTAPIHHRMILYLLERAAPTTLGEPRMSRNREIKYRVVTSFQRRIGNPILARLPFQTLIETTGRKSGSPRRTPIGGRRVGSEFWLVSEFGEKSQYVRNIQAHPAVRLRLKGKWHDGTAHLVSADDARARLKTLPRFNSAAVRAMGTNLLTLRVDLTD